jgi:hypothetical protein
MKIKQCLLLGAFSITANLLFSQAEELTPQEKRYRDSITALNLYKSDRIQ